VAQQETFTLIGRQRHLDTARGWVADLTAGRGRAAFVEGEPGIGKSSLMRTAAREAGAQGCRVFWGTCDELSQAFPLLPLLDALQTHTPTAGNGIRDVLSTDAAPGNRIDVVAKAAERLLALIDESCMTAPVMLVLDDLQFADPATVMTLSRLTRSVRQLPLLLVGIARPVPRREDLHTLRRALDPGCVLTLPSLSATDVAELVASAVGGTPGARLLRLAAGAAGNPLYVTELVDALARARALQEGDGRVEVTGVRPPASLAAAIADRLEFLSTPARDVLRAAALLGADFSVCELAVVVGQRVNELLPVLDEAILARVLLDDGARLAFRHPLIRTALYESMPPAVRAAWHRDAARALAEDGALPDRVAQQLLPVLDLEGAAGTADDWMVRWLAGVGQQLVGQAPRAAIRLLRWAVGGIPAGDAPHDLLTCRLADALYRVGDASEAAEVATGALAYVTEPDLLVDLNWTLTQCRAVGGGLREALASIQRAVGMATIGQQDRARLLVLTARIHQTLGQLEAADRAADRALAAATAAGDRWATGWTLGTMSLAQVMRGEVVDALPTLERALAVAEGDPALADLRLMLQINQASVLGELDRYEDAISAAEQVRRLAEEAGNVVRFAQAQSVLGELLFDVGRWDDALAEVLDPVPAATKNPVVECCDNGVAATIRLHRGDVEASRHLAEAEQYAALLGESRVIGALTLARSLDREQADQPVAALAVLMDGLGAEVEEASESADLLADAARLAVSVGDETAAKTVVHRAEALASSSSVPHRLAIAPHCRGLVDRDPAPLLEAAKHYQEAGRLLPRAQALEAAGVVLADAGDISAARTSFTDAFSLYSDLGAEWDLARTQAAFRTYGIRRGPHSRHRRSRQGWDSLTPTEEKVVRLVARGLSNPQIAAQLFLSRRTVQTHVSHILAKLDLSSRIDIAREAGQRRDEATAVPALVS
jgi:ATP/maltotriose-dependent transcriptional regulator MalT